MENLIAYGGTVKVLEKKADLVTIGGPGVVFDDPKNPVKDLTGDYFTRDTYFGAHKGNGMDVLFHHGFPIAGVDFAKSLAEHVFPAVKVDEEEAALVGSIVLDLRKDYLQRFVYEQAEKGLLSWSTGALPQGVKRMDDGWLKRWIIGEWSLTPTPAEPRTSVLPIKSLMSTASTESEAEAIVKALADLRTEIQTVTALRAIGY